MTETRTAIVVGGARGIGAATSVLLAARGDAVVIVDRAANDPRLPYALATPDDLESSLDAARAVAPDPHLITAAVADATDMEAMGILVADVERNHGGVDVVVTTAGAIAGGVPLWEMPSDAIQAMLDANLMTAIVAARVGIPALLRRPEPRGGRFIAVASAAATRGLPSLAAYCAAKAGVVGLVRALALELRGTGVTANAVSPGSTDTAMLAESARLYSLEDVARFGLQQPIGRLIHPTEIAETIAWLARPEAGATTGGNHRVDGGLTV